MTGDPYQCAHCGNWYPVRVMARDCETRHEADTTPEETP